MAIDRDDLQLKVLGLCAEQEPLSQLQRGVFPDDAEEFIARHLKSKNGALLVSYAGSRRLAGEQVGRELHVDLVVLARSLKGPMGGPSLVAAIEDVLEDARIVLDDGTGFLLTVLSDVFTDEINKVHQYVVRVSCELL